jgi:iron-sulfur cluster insertion protein
MQKKVLLKFSNAAAFKVKDLIEKEKNINLKLRVYIIGGGCSGFKYAFAFDNEKRDSDIFVENQGVFLLVDPITFHYLINSEIDYQKSTTGENFIIRNPNTKMTCGCSSSSNM